jgi:hypothetical protein
VLALDFGLLCLVENRGKLDAAIAKAEGIAREFNADAEVSRLRVNVIIGEVSPDDARAIRAINQEMRDLMDAMASGIATLDVQKVRDAAGKAKSVGKMLEPNAKANVERALTIARKTARDIVKAGETGAIEIDQVAIQRLTEARTAFLDLDLDVETQAPEAATPVAVDFEPEAFSDLTPEEKDEAIKFWRMIPPRRSSPTRSSARSTSTTSPRPDTSPTTPTPISARTLGSGRDCDMPCDRQLKPRQTLTERVREVRTAIERLAAALTAGRVQLKIGPTGAPVFTGWDETSRDGVGDVCAYRLLMSQGSVAAKMAIAKAEQMSGRAVNKQALAQGHHSHDGGVTWHTHKG